MLSFAAEVSDVNDFLVLVLIVFAVLSLIVVVVKALLMVVSIAAKEPISTSMLITTTP